MKLINHNSWQEQRAQTKWNKANRRSPALTMTGGDTHIFLHILRFDGLIGGVCRVERPKGEAEKERGKTWINVRRTCMTSGYGRPKNSTIETVYICTELR